MDRITAVDVFLRTIACGSISGAANELDMSRSMATRYIAALETWADARLLHRTTRRLSLTPAGEAIVPMCQKIMALSQDITLLGGQDSEAPKGMVRLSAPTILAEYYLTEALIDFQARYPEVSIDIQMSDRRSNLVDERIDVAIRVAHRLDPNVIARKLGEVKSVICAAPQYLEAHGTPASIADLSEHNCLIYKHYGQDAWHFYHRGDEKTVTISGNFSTNETTVHAKAALHGAGIALLPDFAVKEHLDTGQLVALLPEYETEALGIYAVFLSRQHMSTAMRALIDFLIYDFKSR